MTTKATTGRPRVQKRTVPVTLRNGEKVRLPATADGSLHIILARKTLAKGAKIMLGQAERNRKYAGWSSDVEDSYRQAAVLEQRAAARLAKAVELDRQAGTDRRYFGKEEI